MANPPANDDRTLRLSAALLDARTLQIRLKFPLAGPNGQPLDVNMRIELPQDCEVDQALLDMPQQIVGALDAPGDVAMALALLAAPEAVMNEELPQPPPVERVPAFPSRSSVA